MVAVLDLVFLGELVLLLIGQSRVLALLVA
ncbi:unannotated protein [freshwater metagenome]|uniref:Unannotated protein n=1 Tax=freshwater metagenome TaxID=449393 RepID=A0A6J7NLF9_9ZZZZ